MKKSLSIITLSSLIILFIILFVLVLTNNSLLLHIDLSIAKSICKMRSSFLNYFMVILSYLGETKLIALFCLIILLTPCRKRFGKYIVFLTILSTILNLSIKYIILRARPDGFFIQEPILFYSFPGGYSFPSGHAQTATTFYISLIYFIQKNHLRNKTIKSAYFILIILFSLLISFSRIYLGVHFFSDVLAGIVLSAIILLLAYMKNVIFPKEESLSYTE